MTYLTKEDWNKYFLPKLSDDKSFHKEFLKLTKIHNILLQIIYLIFKKPKPSQNKLIQQILYTSIIYYNKYILNNDISYTDLSQFDIEIICSSCIFLAFKAINKPISLDFLYSKINSRLSELNKTKKFKKEDISDKIKQKEFDILCSIQFNADIDTPYNFLHVFRSYLQKVQKDNNNYISITINKLNDYIKNSMLFPLHLYYTSSEIALGCILLVKKVTKDNFINLDELIKLTNFEIDIDNIKQCAFYINKLSQEIEASRTKIENNNKISNNNKVPNSNDNGQDNLNFDIISNIQTNII